MSIMKSPSVSSEDGIDLSRRRALARLGLSVAAVYLAPTVLSLSGAAAQDAGGGAGEGATGATGATGASGASGGSGGGSGGSGGGSGGSGGGSGGSGGGSGG